MRVVDARPYVVPRGLAYALVAFLMLAYTAGYAFSTWTVAALTQSGDSAEVTTYDLGGLKQTLGSVAGGRSIVGGNGAAGIRVLSSSGDVYGPSGSFGWQDTGLNASFLASQQ